MSWWISLNYEHGIAAVPSHSMDGTGENSIRAVMYVSNKYGKHFPFPKLHGLQAKETIPDLSGAARRLGTGCDLNYWKPTEGNVGYTCSLLCDWAGANPKAVWEVKSDACLDTIPYKTDHRIFAETNIDSEVGNEEKDGN